MERRPAMVHLLVELGASTSARDPTYNGKPIGWASHDRQRHVVEWLLRYATIFDVVDCGALEHVAQRLGADPTLIHSADENSDPLAFYVHGGIERLDAMIALLRAPGAAFTAKDHHACSVEESMRDRGDSRALSH